MRAEIHKGAVVLRVSRRNITALLHMLDNPVHRVPALSSRDNNIELLVIPEEDEAHYADRPAGGMSWEQA